MEILAILQKWEDMAMYVYVVRHGIDFCGYRVWPTHLKPRKRTITRAKKRLAAIAKRLPDTEAIKAIRAIVTSFFGYIRHCPCRDIIATVLARAIPRRLS